MRYWKIALRDKFHLQGQHDQETHGNWANGAIPDFENSIADIEDREVAGVFDENGNLLYQRTGDKSGDPLTHMSADSVYFTDEEAENMRGKILVHNHPSGTSFSSGDVIFGTDYGLKEIRVVTKDYIYSMQIPEGAKWKTGKETSILDPNHKDTPIQAYNDAEDKYISRANRKLMRGDWVDKDYRAQLPEMYHGIWTDFSKKIGWQYERVKRIK